MINRPMPKPKDFLAHLPSAIAAVRPARSASGAHGPRAQQIPMPPQAARDGPKAARAS